MFTWVQLNCKLSNRISRFKLHLQLDLDGKANILIKQRKYLIKKVLFHKKLSVSD